MTLRMPAEWAPHEAVWIGFPHLKEEWAGQIDAARADVAAFANAVHDRGRGEEVRLVVNDERQAEIAAKLVDAGVRILVQPLGDIWLRDTGPIIAGTGTTRRARNFEFNWWGEKFVMPGDLEVGAALAAGSGLPVDDQDWVLEGGAIDVDGTGLCVTTEECLLNANRNPTLTRADIAARLHQSLGIERLLWLGNGLIGDHTDGHVDNLARFVGPGLVAIPEAELDDPNMEIYADAAEALLDADLDVIAIPSPGLLKDEEGEIIPASYMNFYIGNAAVVVPLYGAPNDDAAVAALQDIFPDRRVIGLRADHVLTGGGSFHCISQQVPA